MSFPQIGESPRVNYDKQPCEISEDKRTENQKDNSEENELFRSMIVKMIQLSKQMIIMV